MRSGWLIRAAGLSALVAAAILAGVIARPGFGAATPTPSPVPTIGSGHICFSAQAIINSCAAAGQDPTFYQDQTVAFRIEMPFYADGWIHIQVSKMAGDSGTTVRELDIQVMANPDGDWNSIGPAAGLKPNAGGQMTTYWVDAYSEGRHIAQGAFQVAGDLSSSPS